jgi:hypothetical protein
MVWANDATQTLISWGCLSLKIDHQVKRHLLIIDLAPSFLDPQLERLQIQRFERSGAVQINAIVSDQKFLTDGKHIGFNTAETSIQSIDQRLLMFVIIMGVRANEWDNLRRKRAGRAENKKQG